MNEQTTLEQPTEQKLLETEIPEHLLLEHPTYKKLEEQLNVAETKANEYWDKLLRSQAEIENLQRRSERDLANAHKYGIEKFARELLAIVDNLERSLLVKNTENEALKDFYVGVELTLKLFLETLQKFGITAINPSNEAFNPEQHTAISVKEDTTLPANTVVEVIQKGYWLNDRLLRPAMVIVTKAG